MTAPTTAPVRRSAAEVARLVADWTGDPCWDLEDTEGFEAHWQELRERREWQEAMWEAEAMARADREAARVAARAAELGCTPALVQYVEALERRIDRLSEGTT